MLVDLVFWIFVLCFSTLSIYVIQLGYIPLCYILCIFTIAIAIAITQLPSFPVP